MAMRGAVTAYLGRSKISSSSSLRNIHNLQTRFHHSTYNSLFTSLPLAKTGFRYPIRAIHEAPTLDPLTPKKGEDAKNKWEVKMLYDGDCPLCLREVNMLRERNKRYGTIEFVDISSDKYSPEENHGLDYETAMGRIHAVMADGTIVTDVEAFRKLYEAVGLGWVYAITKYKPIGAVADAVYSFWAKYRLQVTGRPPMEEILEARKKSKGEVCNDKNTCKM